MVCVSIIIWIINLIFLTENICGNKFRIFIHLKMPLKSWASQILGFFFSFSFFPFLSYGHALNSFPLNPKAQLLPLPENAWTQFLYSTSFDSPAITFSSVSSSKLFGTKCLADTFSPSKLSKLSNTELLSSGHWLNCFCRLIKVWCPISIPHWPTWIVIDMILRIFWSQQLVISLLF